MEEITFLCVLKTGGQYNASHVERLRWQVGQEVVCLTDDPEVQGATIPLTENWPGWWSKLELFKHNLGKCCYLDLDVTVQRLDWVYGLRGDFCAWVDPYPGRVSHLNSSFMLWEGAQPQLIDGFNESRKHEARSDQEWIAKRIHPELVGEPDIVSFKKHGRPREAGLVVYHGHPKPWEYPD